VSDVGGHERVDVVVVGGGNAGFCAAHAATAAGTRTVILEKAPADRAGGNSFYTAGAFRVVHDGLPALLVVLDDESRARADRTSLAPYGREQFHDDMRRLTEGRCDAALTEILVDDSAPIVRWLADVGIRWRLMYERQAYESDGRWEFWGGLAIGVVDGGKGLIAQHAQAAERANVEVRYGAPLTALVSDDGGVTAVRYRAGDAERTLAADAVILTAGGFEASAELRERYLGAAWRRAAVRGTPLNTGEVLVMALDAGAAPYGSWNTCHSVAWDVGAPPEGDDRVLTNQHTRGGYPLGIVVNRDGRRFVDEGADFRNYTYARYGADILAQPDGVAYQLFDAKTAPLLRKGEYDSGRVTGAAADTLDGVAAELGIDPRGLRDTVDAFNAAVRRDVPFDPAVKDGRCTAGIEPPKSNWAQAIDEPPYYGFAVTCGITFTFGGLHVDGHARVLDRDGAPIPGLYAAGEIVGGLFHGNYPGGTGLTAGAVFGRRAGVHAAGRRAAG
jgi:tricarballylate dehydrogenase